MEEVCISKPPCKTPVLRYIQVTKRKEGQSLFTKNEDEVIKGLENLTLSLVL